MAGNRKREEEKRPHTAVRLKIELQSTVIEHLVVHIDTFPVNVCIILIISLKKFCLALKEFHIHSMKYTSFITFSSYKFKHLCSCITNCKYYVYVYRFHHDLGILN